MFTVFQVSTELVQESVFVLYSMFIFGAYDPYFDHAQRIKYCQMQMFLI